MPADRTKVHIQCVIFKPPSDSRRFFFWNKRDLIHIGLSNFLSF